MTRWIRVATCLRVVLATAALLCSMLPAAAPLRAEWVPDGNGICVLPSNQTYVEIVSDGDGGAIMVWTDARNGSGNEDIYAQRVDALGNALWATNGVAVCNETGMQQYPEIVPDGSGGAVIAWLDSRIGGWLIYTQRLDADGNKLWASIGVKILSTDYAAWNHKLAPDNAGGAIVVWTDYRTAEEHVYAQRVAADGATRWTLDGITVCATTGAQQYPEITTDGTHGAFVSWWDSRSANWDIYAQRIKANGTTSWGSGYPVNTYAGTQRYPYITNDLLGGVVIAYQDCATDPYGDIYAARIDTSGTYHFNVPICTATDEQLWKDLVADGSGGAIIVWQDNRTGAGDIYAQRVNKSGSVLWTANGVPVCTESGYQSAPEVVADGSGGAVLTWIDNRTGTGKADIYCQRLSSAGASLWDVGGTPLCTDPEHQTIPMIADDGMGGGIVAWIDQRNLYNDIFASRIERNGYWGYPCATIDGVEDVPHDQGGKVTVRWIASRLDEFPNEVVTHYSVWRSLSGLASFALGEGPVRVVELSDVTPDFEGPAYRAITLGGATYWWEWIANMQAHYLDAYSMTCATLYDSTGADDGVHHFFVAAHTEEPFVFWDSPADSGYSVDNLPPCPPLGLAGEQSFDPIGLMLTWEPNAEVDLGRYAVYRGVSPDFTPSPGNLASSSCDTFLFDDEWRWSSGYYYKLSAIDIHGNESPFALLEPEDVTGGEMPSAPSACYLAQNYPNPFNPATTIRFGLRETGTVSLRIYDASGRLVRVLLEARREAGHYRETWDGLNANGHETASGIYFYRLTGPGFEEARKMILLR